MNTGRNLLILMLVGIVACAVFFFATVKPRNLPSLSDGSAVGDLSHDAAPAAGDNSSSGFSPAGNSEGGGGITRFFKEKSAPPVSQFQMKNYPYVQTAMPYPQSQAPLNSGGATTVNTQGHTGAQISTGAPSTPPEQSPPFSSFGGMGPANPNNHFVHMTSVP